MSIFNLNTLKEATEEKKQELEQIKETHEEIKKPSQYSATHESLFTVALYNMRELDSKINACIAYNESLLETENNVEPIDIRTTLIDSIKLYIDNYQNLYKTLKEKVKAISDSFNMLDTAKLQDDLVSFYKEAYNFTNLGFMVNRTSLISEMNSQICNIIQYNKENSPEEPFSEDSDIETFRLNLRERILGSDDYALKLSSVDPSQARTEYIKLLYGIFRDYQQESTIQKYDKEKLLELISEYHHNKYIMIFEKETRDNVMYLQTLINTELANEYTIDTMTIKRINVILDDYLLLYAARADAIVEYYDTIRDLASSALILIGGEE